MCLCRRMSLNQCTPLVSFPFLKKKNWGIIYKEWNVYHLISSDKCIPRYRPYPDPLKVPFVPLTSQSTQTLPLPPKRYWLFRFLPLKTSFACFCCMCKNGMRDLSLLTRDGTRACCSGSTEWFTTGLPRRPLSLMSVSHPCCCIHQQFITASNLKKSCKNKNSTKNTCHIIFTHVHLLTQTNVFKIQIY